MLHHQRQQGNTCAYMAVYALTGDEVWLAYARDAPDTCQDDLPLVQRLAEVGTGMFSHYTSRCDFGQPVDPAYWSGLRHEWQARSADQSPVPLLVAIQASEMYHCVAVHVYLDTEMVWVSDSNRVAPEPYTWPEFLATAYARAYRIEMLIPLQ